MIYLVEKILLLKPKNDGRNTLLYSDLFITGDLRVYNGQSSKNHNPTKTVILQCTPVY